MWKPDRVNPGSDKRPKLAFGLLLVVLFPIKNVTGDEFAFHSEHFLTTGDTQDISLQFPALGAYAITVKQEHVDVVVTVLSPDNAKSITVNNPLPFHWYDTVLIKANSLQPYTLRLLAISGHTQGRIEIDIEPIAATHSVQYSALTALTLASSLAYQHENNFTLRQDAVHHYERAIEHWRKLGNRMQQGRAHASLAALLLRIEKNDESLAHFTSAIKLLTAENMHYLLAAVYTDTGYAFIESDDIDSARVSFEQALHLARQFDYRQLEAWNISNIGFTMLELGKHKNALEKFQSAHAIFAELGDLSGEAIMLSNIATSNKGLGFPDRAIDNWKQALALNSEFINPQEHAAFTNNLGILYRQLGEFDDALLYFESLTAMWRKIGYKRELARNLNSIGWVYISLGDHARARSLFEEALEFRQQIKDRQGEAFTLNALGELGIRQARWADAKKALDQAWSIFHTLKLPDGKLANLTARAQLELLQEKPKVALSLLDKAVTILKDMDERRDAGDLAIWRGKALLALGKINKAQKSFQNALVITRKRRQEVGQAQALYGQALAYYAADDLDNAMTATDDAIIIIESMRTNLSNPQSRGLFLETLRGAYELRISLWMQLHLQNPDAGHEVSAFLAAEGARARMFLDFMQVARIDIYGMADQEQLNILSTLRHRLAFQVDQQVNGVIDTNFQEQLNRDVFDTRTSLDALEARIRENHPRISTVAPAVPPELEDMQKLLDNDEALLEYALGEKHSFLWVLTPDTVHSFRLPGRDEIEALARDFYRQLRTLNASVVANQLQDQAGLKLSKILLDPAYDLLDGKSLVIVADGALNYVPFAVLPAPKRKENYRSEPLLVKHEITMIPSASSMVAMRRLSASRPQSTKTLALLADPVFNQQDPRLQTDLSGVITTAATRTNLSRIPWTRNEANAIAALVPAEHRSSAFDFDATREFLLDQHISDYRVIHLATHGYLNHQQPQLSGLVLSRYNNMGEAIKGNVNLQDIFTLELSADLVVLSACESALGEEIRGEGLVGITHGFMYAGVPRVIASMWLVKDDHSTVQFMQNLYSSMLNKGLSPAAALRQAQLALRSNRKRRDPYYWGAFSLLGDWRAMATPLGNLHVRASTKENGE